MERRNFIQLAGVAALATTTTGLFSSCASPAGLKSGQILHTVIFDLKHAPDSPEAKKFLSDAHRILTAIPGVRDFQAYKQCSAKNDFQYGFLMTFNDQQDYDAYNIHPAHSGFVEERWNTEVSRFQESDFVQL